VNQEELAKIRMRFKLSTPRPFKIKAYQKKYSDVTKEWKVVRYVFDHDVTKADYDLILHAKQDIAALLNHIEILSKAVDCGCKICLIRSGQTVCQKLDDFNNKDMMYDSHMSKL